jgi:hypothetical protein
MAALNSLADINSIIGHLKETENLINPEVFYDKQLLDTLRLDKDS